MYSTSVAGAKTPREQPRRPRSPPHALAYPVDLGDRRIGVVGQRCSLGVGPRAVRGEMPLDHARLGHDTAEVGSRARAWPSSTNGRATPVRRWATPGPLRPSKRRYAPDVPYRAKTCTTGSSSLPVSTTPSPPGLQRRGRGRARRSPSSSPRRRVGGGDDRPLRQAAGPRRPGILDHRVGAVFGLPPHLVRPGAQGLRRSRPRLPRRTSSGRALAGSAEVTLARGPEKVRPAGAFENAQGLGLGPTWRKSLRDSAR